MNKQVINFAGPLKINLHSFIKDSNINKEIPHLESWLTFFNWSNHLMAKINYLFYNLGNWWSSSGQQVKPIEFPSRLKSIISLDGS